MAARPLEGLGPQKMGEQVVQNRVERHDAMSHASADGPHC